MQYRVDLSHQNREKGQCAYVHNLCTLFMHAYLIVHDPKTTARCCETFRTIIICDIESIRATKLDQSAENLFFCTFLHNLCTLCIPN